MRLNPYLKDFWKAKSDESGNPIWARVLYGGRASSKCVHYLTNIKMYGGGTKLAFEIKVGDKLVGLNGTPRTVVDVCSGYDDMYIVEQDDKMSYFVTGNHVMVLDGGSIINTSKTAFDCVNVDGLKGCFVHGNSVKKTNIKVRYADVAHFIGIETDGDHIFQLSDGTLVHNSHEVAGVMIARANYQCERILCLRMYQNRIQDSVYSLLKDKVVDADLRNNFKIYKDAIEHKKNGSIFRFYGCARNIDEVKSFERATVCWVEEAHNFTEEMLRIVKPTIMRNAGAEMIFTFNPQLYSDFIYQRFVVSPPRGCISRLVNYTNNPFLEKGMIREILNEKAEDEELYRHIYLGVPLLDDDKAIIKRTWCEAAIDAHKKLEVDLFGADCVGYDVADSGIDRNCAVVFNGSVATDLDSWKAGEDELRESLLRAYGKVIEGGKFVYDCIGVGAHIGSTLKSMGVEYGHYKFNAGDAVKDPDSEYSHNITNKQKFENRKVQAWQSVSDRLRNTYNAVKKGMQYEAHELISLDSNLPQLQELITELCIPYRTYSKRGMDMLETKKEIKKRLKTNKSPDLADAFVIAASPGFADMEELSFFDIDW